MMQPEDPVESASQASGIPPPAIPSAHERIKPQIHQTPILTSTLLDIDSAPLSLYFKAEPFQKTGSFKARGALNALSLLPPGTRPVVTHSSGNHAQALAYAARHYKRKCICVVPQNASKAKVNAAKAYGAEIVRCEDSLEDRARVADWVVKETDGILIHPFLNRDVIAGQGTMGLEILEQVKEVEAIVVPVGGGGLIAGIALAVKSVRPDVRIIGAEPRLANAGKRSLERGRRVEVDGRESVAEGVRASLGEVGWEVVRRLVDDIVEVGEGEIREAVRLIWSRLKVVVEWSGGVAYAAVRGEGVRRLGVKRVCVVLCGGNLDLGEVGLG